MIVRLASRMFSAISFGVFCRCAPSTNAIIRSMKVSPGFDVISTTMRSDSTLVPPVTALRSPPDSRITGADSPVIADSSTDATPSTTSPSPGMISPASTTHRSPGCSCVPGHLLLGAVRAQASGDRLLPGRAQRGRLRLAAAFGHGLGEVREEHGQPQPDDHGSGEQRRIADEQERGQDGPDLHDEHHGVLPQDARVELAERVGQRSPDEMKVDHRVNPSTSGPSERAGK